MKITGWRSLKTIHRWQCPVGDVNGTVESGITDVTVLILETEEGLGGHDDIERVFPAIENANCSPAPQSLLIAGTAGCIPATVWHRQAH